MVFRGEVLPISTLLDVARHAPPAKPAVHVGVLHTAAGNALTCARLVADGDPPEAGWRYGILQTLDDYTSTLARGGRDLAAEVFADEPAPTGSPQLDAAFAALADHLAQRDGWVAPRWVRHPARHANGWFPAVPLMFRDEAYRDSPSAFRRRGIFITSRSLDRA
jgi:hypothetical protein